jgi:hypothetical protein
VLPGPKSLAEGQKGCSDYPKRQGWDGLLFALQSEERVPIHEFSRMLGGEESFLPTWSHANICLVGAVTRTQIGRAQSGGPSSGLGSGSGFPCPECFVSEDAESVAGCEMALDVEGVEDRGVNRKEALG